MRKYILVFSLVMLVFNCSSEPIVAQESPVRLPFVATEITYFPPNNSDIWESVTLNNWDQTKLQPLLDFLELKNSKGFIILHKGKIVLEHYMNGHAASSNWYWASAGKTLTTTVVGIAEDDNLLDINAKVSDYIGTGWTNTTLAQENLITNKNLLNMTSGLDDANGDDVSPSQLNYIANAGSRWAYHNVFVKLQDVVAQSSNETWMSYFNSELKNKIGMNGTWIPFGNANVYWSTARSMARFGLMISAQGKWNDSQIVSQNYLNEAINPSQSINDAYGYLWWLNGKRSYHLPQSQVEFQGQLIPNAPTDMYCALGKNDQKIYIVPSCDLVIVRQGEAADSSVFGVSDFDNDLWQKINELIN